MPGPEDYAYAVLRLVPDVERGERLNVAVVLFCRRRGFLGMAARLDPERVRALAPETDVDAVGAHLRRLQAVAEGNEEGGAVARLPASERFGWLTAPSSTIVQPSEVHTGLCDDPAATLRRLADRLV